MELYNNAEESQNRIWNNCLPTDDENGLKNETLSQLKKKQICRSDLGLYNPNG